MAVDLAAAADVSALPYATAASGPLPGEIRAEPSDFQVEEIPAYEPSGQGDHLYVRFEKTSLDTPEAVRRLARVLEVDPRDAGWAGLKDRHAVTVQWASFLFGDAARLAQAAIDGVRVLETGRHANKLRTGHLRGNRFGLLVRGAPAERLDEVRERLQVLEGRGVPNYFGQQRFGRGHANLTNACRWILEGGRAPRKPFQRKLLVSSLQSALFNELLAERVAEESYDGVIEGDLLRKEDTGGLFVSEDLAQEAQRVRRFEISATGPMFGSRMRWPEGLAQARERATLTRWGLTPESLSSFRRAGSGTRRPYRVRLGQPKAEARVEGLWLSFTLPSGAYATVVLRELLRSAVA